MCHPTHIFALFVHLRCFAPPPCRSCCRQPAETCHPAHPPPRPDACGFPQCLIPILRHSAPAVAQWPPCCSLLVTFVLPAAETTPQTLPFWSHHFSVPFHLLLFNLPALPPPCCFCCSRPELAAIEICRPGHPPLHPAACPALAPPRFCSVPTVFRDDLPA